MFNRFSLYFTKNISYINFCISLSTLTFQITLLNPWHKYSDNKFNNIDTKYDNISNKIDIVITKIDTINNRNNSVYYKNDKKISYKE
jgi:hypothetical protein